MLFLVKKNLDPHMLLKNKCHQKKEIELVCFTNLVFGLNKLYLFCQTHSVKVLHAISEKKLD